MKKRIASIILTCCMVLSLLPTVAFAGNVLEDKSGYCGAVGDGTNLSWSYDSSWENLRLTISGSGAMKNYGEPYSSDDIAPWYNNETNNVVVANIKINEGVTSIGAWAFSNIDFTKYEGWEGNVSLPSTLTGVGENAFDNCVGLSEVTFGGTVAQWKVIDISETGNMSLQAATIHCSDGDIEGYPTSGTCGDNLTWEIYESGSYYSLEILGIGEMDDYSWENPSPWMALSDRLNAIEIGSGVTSIGAYAFVDCANLADVTIPESVTSIGENAFNHCEGLDYIEIPDGVTIIGDRAFVGCFGLTEISIPASVTHIGDYAFGRCFSLSAISVSKNNTVYSDVEGVLFNKVQTELVSFPSGKAPTYTDEYGNILPTSEYTYVVPDGVTKIATSAFYESPITGIVFPNTLQEICEDAFRNWYSRQSAVYVGTESQWSEVTIGDGNALPEIQFDPNYNHPSGGGLVDDGSNPPTAPATAPTVTAKTTTTISISWDAGDDDVGIYGYDVYLNGQRIAELDGADVRSYQITDLEQGQEYEIKVKTVDTGGHESEDFSQTLTAAPLTLDVNSPKINDTFIVDELEGKEIWVVTSVSTEDEEYNVALDNVKVQYRASGATDWITQEYGMKVDAENSCNASGWFYISGNGEDGYLPMGQYDVRFSVVDSEGATAVSEAKTITLKFDDIPPTAPGTATLDSRNTVTVNFHWNASTDNVGVDHYVIYRDGVEVGTSTTTSYSDTGLTMATSYAYTIKAVDARDNVSEASESATLKTATLSFNSYTGFDETYMMEEQNQYKISLAAEASSDGTLSAVIVRMEYKGSEDTDWESVSMTKTSSTANTYSGNWPVKMNGEYLSPDAYNVRFVITDGYSSVTSDAQTVNLIRDNIDPVVQSISKPVANETYGGKDFSIEYRATDNIGVTQADIAYSVDGTAFTAITSKIYNELKDTTDQLTWDATALASGTYQLRVSVRDAMNNVGTMIRQFNLDNTPPVPVSDLTASGNTRYVTLSWSHSDPEEDMTYKIYRGASADGEYTEIKEQSTQGFNEGQDVITPGATYYYKVTALDRFGNESESPAAVSTSIVLDTESPSITEMTPADSAELCKTAAIRVAAADNYMLDHAVLEYRASGVNSWTAIDTQQAAANASRAVFTKTWDIANLSTGDYELRASVYDSTVNDTLGGKYAANAPGTMTKKVHITKYTPPVAPVVSAEAGYKTVSLNWTYSGNADLLSSFSIYKASSENGPYSLVKNVTPTTKTYSGAIPADQTVFFKVVANDKYEATAESTVVSVTSIPEDTENPVAVILPETLLTATNLPFQFSGVYSTDNNEIVSYAWDFGDGTSSTEITPEHTYAAAGNYPVKLTVKDAFDNSNTAAATIQVVDTAEAGSEYTMVTIKTVDASVAALTPISNASVSIYFENGDETTAVTGDDGMVTLLLPVGKHVIGASAGNYVPTTKNLIVQKTETGAMDAVVGLSAKPLVTGKLTAEEMTLEEINQAGIDVNASDNQHVWKYSVTFEFIVAGEIITQPVIVGYKTTSNAGEPGPDDSFIPNKSGWVYLGGSGSGGGPGGGSGSGGSGITKVQILPTTVEGYYLIIYGEAHWLKEMYNVELLVTNESYLDTIEDCVAELELPDGLSLATMIGEQQTAQINLGKVAPAGEAVARWYVRGDKEGEYDISANLTGELVSGSISEPFSYNFKTDDPVKVYAGSALKMTVIADDLAINGEEYHVKFRLENVSDKSLYNLSFGITGVEEGQFIRKTTGNNQTSEERTETYSEDFADQYMQSVTELKAGDYIECEVNISAWFETEETLQAKSKALFRTSDYRAAYIDLSSGIGSIEVATLEGSTTSVPSEIIINTSEKAEKEQQIFDRLVKRVTYDPDNPDVVILLIYDPVEETDPQESMSGIIQEGDGWAMRWKVTYYVDKNGQKYDPKLEIYMDGVDEEDSYKYSISLTDEDASPWLTATGFDKTDFVSLKVSGTKKNPIEIVTNHFYGYTNIKEVLLDYISSIDGNAFENCTSLETVNGMGNSLQGIGPGAFKNCCNLKNIYGNPVNMTGIGSEAFKNTKISSINLGEKLTRIKANAFEDCGSLTTITIPVTLETVEEGAFAGCSNLKDVFFNGTVAKWNEIVIGGNNDPLLNATIHYASAQSKSVNVTFLGGIYKESPPSMDIMWGFDMLKQDAHLPISNDLAITSLVLAGNAYDRTRLKDTMETLGLENFASDNYDGYDDINRVAYGIASTVTIIDGYETNVIAISCRGSATILQDWVSNIIQQSQGFRFAAEDIKKDLSKYILDHDIDLSLPTKILITGHSRGGAVANILGTILSDVTTNDNVFVCTFACPNTTDDENRRTYSNIKNYIVEGDLVPLVPPLPGGANKFGHYRILNISHTNYFGISFTLLTGVDKSHLENGPLNSTSCVSDYPVGSRYHAPATYMACLLGNEGTEAWKMQTKYRITSIKCPVDVEVYDDDGTLLGRIIDNQAEETLLSHGIIAVIDGEKKYLYTTEHTDLQKLVLLGTDTGTMEYSVQIIDADTGNAIEEKTYKNVLLSDGKYMLSYIGGDIETENVPLYISNDDENEAVIAEIQEDGTEVPIQYTLTFNNNGYGTAPAAITVNAGDKATEPTAPTASGYTFGGWFKESACTNKWDFASDTVTSNLTLYAKWTVDSSGGGGGGVGGGASGGTATSDSDNPVALPTTTDNENASVKSDTDSAKTGDTVTVTVIPDEGYKVDGVKITDKNGNPVEVTDNGDGTYSFKMPAGGVKVEPIVIEDEGVPTSGGKFVDVPKDAYYADAVDWAVKNAITTGTSETTFSPNEGCTRAQVVTFLWRAAGEPEATTTSTFSDVSADKYYAAAVAWAVENKITEGIGDGKFGPDQTCTRGQIVTFLWRYQHTPVPTTNASFSDVADTAYYAQPVAWAVENQITNGVGDNKFAPNDTCTRAQVVTFLYRCMSE